MPFKLSLEIFQELEKLLSKWKAYTNKTTENRSPIQQDLTLKMTKVILNQIRRNWHSFKHLAQ